MRPERQPVDAACDRPGRFDWPFFEAWAAMEGWRVPAWELALYRNELADSAFVRRDHDRTPVGFVTVCRHQRTGWIGNLLVDPFQRGKGHGRRLFAHAVDTLCSAGINTLWLTASAAGRPLYEACGFHETGRVERWVWRGIGGGLAADVSGDLHALVRADAFAWGDSRAGLLTLLARGGRVLAVNDTVALLQGRDDLQVLGPWLSADRCPRSNRTVLAAALETCAGRGELAVDVVGASPVRRLLGASGFAQTGETVLMVRGRPGAVKYGEIVALASLGSMG